MPSYMREASRDPFVLKISLLAALGGLLFGYDTGVVSGALLYIKKDLHAGDLAQSWIVAGLLVGAVFGALAGGRLADLVSRRWTLLAAGIVYVLSALAAALAQSSGQLVAAFLVLGMLLVPYSPRWLMQKGRGEEAREVLRRTRPGEDFEDELSEIESVLSRERRAGLRELLSPAVRPMLVVGIGLAVIQQVVGVNTVVYFLPTILTYTGLHANDAIAQALSVGITNVVFTVLAVLLLDRVGRRVLLIVGTAGLTVALATLGAFFAFHWKDDAPWVALVALVVFIASFAIGLGPVFWLYAALAVVGIVFFVTRVPETKNRTLEEIERDLGARTT